MRCNHPLISNWQLEIGNSVDSFYNSTPQLRERTDIAHAVPGIKLARRLSFSLVTLKKTRHEELLRQRRQTHATRPAISDNSVGIIRVHYFNHCSRQRRIINDREIVFRLMRFVYRQSHQRVAISRRKVCTFEQLFHCKTMKLRRHLCAAAKDARDAELLKRDLFTQRFQELRRRKQAMDVVVGPQHRQTLFDYVLLVLLGHLYLAHFQKLDDPTRIEIYHETDPSAILGQMFNCQPQATRAGWAKR